MLALINWKHWIDSDCKRTFPTALCLGGSLKAIRRSFRGRVDLIVSCLGLHWTNDLPGAMIQSRLALKPDGLFLAAIFGGETLRELRIACTLAHMEREGGISPRVSPLAQILKRETALATAAIYDSMFAAEDGTIPATFQVIYMTGWKEHSSQQKAKRRGSATISFSDIKKQFGNDH
ncbi:putative methyltransferase, partial [Cucurbita argyrosperma subsp. argyrosperma]